MKKNIINPWSPDRWTVPEELLCSSMPKITIGILSYNRKTDLRRTLDCITRAVQYPDMEVIVVDNASEDGSVAMVGKEFPGIAVIALDKNIGTAGRNLFYHKAKGKFVFSFDDDSFPATPSVIFEVVSLLNNHPEIDSLTLYCFQSLSGFAETGEIQKFRFSGTQEKGYEGLFFAEGAMCIRTSSWIKIDGYDPDFVWGAEGADLTLQMYKHGMKTMYHPGFAILHMKSNVNRNSSTNIYFFTRNYIWTINKHFPLYSAVPITFLYVLRKLIASILYPSFFGTYMRGIKDGLLGILIQRKKTKKLSLRQVLGLKRWYFFLYRW